MKDKCELNTVWFEMGFQYCLGSQRKRMPTPLRKCDYFTETIICAVTYHCKLGEGKKGQKTIQGFLQLSLQYIELRICLYFYLMISKHTRILTELIFWWLVLFTLRKLQAFLWILLFSRKVGFRILYVCSLIAWFNWWTFLNMSSSGYFYYFLQISFQDSTKDEMLDRNDFHFILLQLYWIIDI